MIIKFLCISLFFIATTLHAATLSGRVVAIADGDTITILDSSNTQYKIRLAGIDAPEKKQPFGNVSKKSLSDMVYGKQVSVDYNKQDRYGRTVGKVIVDGVDANLQQVKRGLAWFYKKYQNEQPLEDRLDYLHAQQDAEQSKVGLWTEPSPIPPRDFRKSKKQGNNNNQEQPVAAATQPIDEPASQPVVVKKSAVISSNSKSDSEHCYDLATDAAVLKCLKYNL
jgi:endonuclease YncB( thermonuclease family)